MGGARSATLSIGFTTTAQVKVEAYVISTEADETFYTWFDELKIEITNKPTAVVVQENHYYPFGLGMKGLDYTAPSPNRENKFQFNGKEKQPELSLNWIDYGARNYDAQIGRWHSIDGMAEKYISYTPYVYVRNNPISRYDPNGLWDVEVHLYGPNRDVHGVAIVKDRHGNEVYRFKVLGRGSSDNRYASNIGDTPTGTYKINEQQPWLYSNDIEGQKAYGRGPRLVFEGISGEIVATRRSAIRIHGGSQEKYDSKTKSWVKVKPAELRITNGCMRCFDDAIAEMKAITDDLQANDAEEKPGVVEVKDDLVRWEQDGIEEYLDPESMRVRLNMLFDRRARERTYNEAQKVFDRLSQRLSQSLSDFFRHSAEQKEMYDKFEKK